MPEPTCPRPLQELYLGDGLRTKWKRVANGERFSVHEAGNETHHDCSETPRRRDGSVSSNLDYPGGGELTCFWA